MITKAIQISRINIAGPYQVNSWVVGVSFSMHITNTVYTNVVSPSATSGSRLHHAAAVLEDRLRPSQVDAVPLVARHRHSAHRRHVQDDLGTNPTKHVLGAPLAQGCRYMLV